MGKDVVWTKEIVPNGGIDETRSPTQIEDHKWTAASNVEPLPDGVRTRQGINKSNTALSGALQVIAEDYDGGTADWEMQSAASVYIAQQFQNAAALSVSRVAVRMRLSAGVAGSLVGNISVAIYEDSSDDPAAAVTGADFSDFSEIVSTTLTSEYLWYFFTLDDGVTPTPVTLDAATPYHLVIRHADAQASASNNISLETEATGAEYAYVANKSPAAVLWTVTAADINFRIYSGAGAITGIHDYWLSDGSTQRHIVMHDRELYKNSGGTMAPVSTRLREGFTASANTFPSFAVGQDRLLIAHGQSDTPQKFHVKSAVEYHSNQGLAPPTATPTVAESTVGGSTLAAPEDYYVDYYYWNDDLAIKSNSWAQGTSSVHQLLTAANNTITVSNIPTAVAREGDLATHVRILLRDASVPESVFTYQQQISFADLVTSGGDVVITDRNIGTEGEYNHNVPPTHSINCVAANRQFVGGDPTYPWRLWYSLIVGAVSYYESFPTTSFRDFGQGDADYITALKFIPPRHVMVGMKNSVWIIDANRPGTSEPVRVARGIGIAAHNAAIVVGRTVFFVSDGDRSKGMFVWRGAGEPQPVFGIDDTFKALSQGRLQYASCAHYAPGDNRHQWWTVLTSAGSTHDTILVYDYALDAWTKYPVDVNVIGEVESSSIERLFLGGYDGFERQGDSGTQDDSTDITWSWASKAYDFGTQEIKKRVRFMDYVAAAKTEGSMNLSLDFDFGSGQATSATLAQIGDSNTGVWGKIGDVNFKWGDGSIWGTSTANISGRVGINGVGKFVQSTINGSKPSHLKGLSWGTQATGRR